MKKISWSESKEYVRATRRQRVIGVSFNVIYFFVFMLCCSPLAFVSALGFWETVSLIVSTSLFLLIAVNLISLYSGSNIKCNKNGILVNSCTFHSYKKVSVATVGEVEIQGKAYPVFSFVTTDNDSHCYGLATKIDPQSLWQFLKSKGVKLE